MTMIALTRQDAPPRPVLINPDHVASINPLVKLKPIAETQTPQVMQVYSGTEVRMADGSKHNVLEDYEDVANKLSGNWKEGIVPLGEIPDLTESKTFTSNFPTEFPDDVTQEPQLYKSTDPELAGNKIAAEAAEEKKPPAKKTTQSKVTKKDEEGDEGSAAVSV